MHSFDTDRISRLREVVEAQVRSAFPDQPVLEQVTRVMCDGCGAVTNLDMERFGLDWPEQLEDWRTFEGVGDLCPVCAERQVGGDDEQRQE